MTEFNKTNWANPEFVREYREKADIYIVERQRMFEIMQSYHRHFMQNRRGINMLDLGCGDGIVTQKLMAIDPLLSATLIDASEDMLEKARERLTRSPNIHYVRASFQEILENDILKNGFDCIASSMAIHHLTNDEKLKFFNIIFDHLIPGGYCLNIDVTIAPTEALEEWYMKLWKEWMDNEKTSVGMEDVSFDDIIRRYKEAEENKPGTVDYQLNALRSVGFRDVDCFYKYGVFAICGGRK